jgi:arylformamidase
VTRLVDLSHEIRSGMVTYPGLPAPIVCDYWRRADHDFHIAKIEMVANTGTYLDTPFHRYADGDDLARVGLARCAELDAVVVRTGERAVIGADAIAGLDVRDRAVLFHTGWSRHWGSDAYAHGHPHLDEPAAIALRDGGAALVGIDSLNIDDTAGGSRPVHAVLLAAGILIAEHLCRLDQLPDAGFTFTATPPKFAGVGTFPVRAFARLSA